MKTSEWIRDRRGTWRHARIVLYPDTTAEGYAPIILEDTGEEEVR